MKYNKQKIFFALLINLLFSILIVSNTIADSNAKVDHSIAPPLLPNLIKPIDGIPLKDLHEPPRSLEIEKTLREKLPNNLNEIEKYIKSSLFSHTADEGGSMQLIGIKNYLPQYIGNMNRNAAITSNVDLVLVDTNNFNLSGNGVNVGLWEAKNGHPMINHLELENRIIVHPIYPDNYPNISVNRIPEFFTSAHATHVAGTIAASGKDPNAKGMAWKLDHIDCYNSIDIRALEKAAQAGLLVSNHSYGQLCGWQFNLIPNLCGIHFYWLGDAFVSNVEDYRFGFYSAETSYYDYISFIHPDHLMVISAGNDRGDRFNSILSNWCTSIDPNINIYCQDYMVDWELATDPNIQRMINNPNIFDISYICNFRRNISINPGPPDDGGIDGYDTLNPFACTKNSLVVGAVKDIPQRYTNPNDVIETILSSFGPTDDGRIKPDIVANGEALYSSSVNVKNPSDNKYYQKMDGTSMAAPVVTGTVALLIEHYRNAYDDPNYIPSSATIKALLIHTANDAGDTGPDYKFGWGLLNSKEAVDLIACDGQMSKNNLIRGWFIKERILNGIFDQDSFEVMCDGNKPLKVTIAWTDPPGTSVLTPNRYWQSPASLLDPPDLMLVNDLDLKLISENGRIYGPWVLDPANPNADAIQTNFDPTAPNSPLIQWDNFRDNVEQVYIESPSSSTYTINVSHKGSLRHGQQRYSIISNYPLIYKNFDKIQYYIYYLKGMYDMAFDYINEGINIDPNNGWAYATRGSYYFDLGLKNNDDTYFHQAIIDCNTAINLGYVESNVYLTRGRTKFNLQQFQDAIDDFNKTIELDPNLCDGFLYRAWCNGILVYLNEKNLSVLNDIIFDIDIALNLNCSILHQPFIPYFIRASAYYMLGNYELALSDYNNALMLNPDLKLLNVYIGQMHTILGNHEDAVDYLNTAYNLGFTDEVNYKIHHHIGNAYYCLGLPQDAVNEFKEAIKLDPDNVHNYYNLGNCYKMINNPSEAIYYYNNALVMGYDYVGLYAGRGNAYGHLNRYNEAISDFTIAIELDPNYFLIYDMYLLRGVGYNRINEFTSAIHDLDIAINNLDKITMQSPVTEGLSKATIYFERAQSKLNLELYKEAIADYSIALEIYKDCAFYINKALAYFQCVDCNNNYSNAINEFNTAENLGCNLGINIGVRAYCLMELEQYNEAIIDFNEAIKLEPNNPKTYVDRGTCYLYCNECNNNYAKAINDFDVAINNLGYNEGNKGAYAYLQRGNAKLKLKKYNDAIEDLTIAINLDPNYTSLPYLNYSYGNRGYCYLQVGEYVNALIDYNTVIDLNAEGIDIVNSYGNRGYIRLRLEMYQDAIDDFNEAITLDPNYPEDYFHRGICHAELDNYSDAIDDFSKAINLGYDKPWAYKKRADAKLKIGNYNEAINDYTEAITSDKDYGFAYIGRSLCYSHLNDEISYFNDSNAAIDLLGNIEDETGYREWAYIRQGHKYYHEAISNYTEVIENDGWAYAQRGWCYNEVKEYRNALDDFKKAISLGHTKDWLYNLKNKIERKLNPPTCWWWPSQYWYTQQFQYPYCIFMGQQLCNWRGGQSMFQWPALSNPWQQQQQSWYQSFSLQPYPSYTMQIQPWAKQQYQFWDFTNYFQQPQIFDLQSYSWHQQQQYQPFSLQPYPSYTMQILPWAQQPHFSDLQSYIWHQQ